MAVTNCLAHIACFNSSKYKTYRNMTFSAYLLLLPNLPRLSQLNYNNSKGTIIYNSYVIVTYAGRQTKIYRFWHRLLANKTNVIYKIYYIQLNN